MIYPATLEFLMSQLTIHRTKKVTIIFGNFHQLPHELINELRMSTWTKLAKKTIGNDAWEVASTVMVYQRHRNLGFYRARAAIKKDLKSDFVLQREEVHQLLSNQRFYASCSEAFTNFVSRNYVGAPTARTSSFSTDATLSTKLFYEIWLTSLYYEYESVSSLVSINLRTLSTREYADFNLVCHIMRNNYLSKEFGCSPPKRCNLFENHHSSGFFDISFCADIVLGPVNPTYEVNPALYVKMVTQIRAGFSTLDSGFLPTLVEFMVDYPKMTTEELVKKYALDRGAEYIIWRQLRLEWAD